MRYLFTLTCLLFVTATVADEADLDFSSLRAKKALRDYKKAIAEDEEVQAQKQKLLDEEGAKAAKQTRDAFVENLKKALKKSMQAGNLEEANKIDAAIKALKQGGERKEKAETNRPTKVTYWPNGQKRSEEHWKDGKREGLVTRWHENGKKYSEIRYKNGERKGLATSWHKNGQKQYEGHYKNDQPAGLWTDWHENGQKREERHFKDGKEVSRKEF